MIAVDTNILVYAHREHSVAVRPRIPSDRDSPTHLFAAYASDPGTRSSGRLARGPTLVLLAESDTHWSTLRSLLVAGRIEGPRVHDARIAALCQQHGVRELWFADRDFNRFGGLTAVNPLVGRHE